MNCSWGTKNMENYHLTNGANGANGAKGTSMDTQKIKQSKTSRHLFAPSQPHASGSSFRRPQFSWHRWLLRLSVTQTVNHSAGLPVSTKVAMAKLGTAIGYSFVAIPFSLCCDLCIHTRSHSGSTVSTRTFFLILEV